MKPKLKSLAQKVYNYHNLGAGIFPEGEEKTPYGSGERYNFDRMYMMVSNYDFTKKNIIDLGCNSGWFCIQAKLLGTNVTVGIDYEDIGIMGGAIQYAIKFEKYFKLGLKFMNADLEGVDFLKLARRYDVEQFDASLLLSILHHIKDKNRLCSNLFEATKEVIFYEDHEFWNDLADQSGEKIAVRGEGYRFGWNEDMSWQRKIHSIESYEPKILDYYYSTWRRDTLMLDQFREVRFLGFSEKRRPILALFK
jgi:SAM-dependent methyltransferase